MSANPSPSHNTLCLHRNYLLMLEGDAAAILLSQIVFWGAHTSTTLIPAAEVRS